MALLLFWAILRSTGGDSLHSSESIKIEERSVFSFSAPQVSAWGALLSQCWLVFLLVGMGAFTCGGFLVSLSVEVVPSSTGGFSPIPEPWVPGYLVSLALGLSSHCLRHIQVACSYRCRSCSSHASPALFFLAKTSALWV